MADPSGGTFYAAGDFDGLLPVTEDAFPVLVRIDPYGDIMVPDVDLATLAYEVDRLLKRVDHGPERHGLLRLRALA